MTGPQPQLEYAGEDPLSTVAVQYLEDLRLALTGTAGGVPERCLVIPGGEVAWDQPNQAWVRLVQVLPSPINALPSGQLRRPVIEYLAQFELGVLRPVHVVSEAAGRPVIPTAEDLSKDALVILDDARAMRVLANYLSPYKKDATPVQWVPVGPTGGAAGGTFILSVPFADCAPILE